jgi:hypothetical protein
MCLACSRFAVSCSPPSGLGGVAEWTVDTDLLVMGGQGSRVFSTGPLVPQLLMIMSVRVANPSLVEFFFKYYYINLCPCIQLVYPPCWNLVSLTPIWLHVWTGFAWTSLYCDLSTWPRKSSTCQQMVFIFSQKLMNCISIH